MKYAEKAANHQWRFSYQKDKKVTVEISRNSCNTATAKPDVERS